MVIQYSDFRKEIALGELKNTPAINTSINRAEIRDDFKPEILSLVNRGLFEITNKIPVFTKDIYLVFQDNVNTYLLKSTGVGSYLDETGVDTFSDNYLKILDIFDENNNRYSVDTREGILSISYNTLRFSDEAIEVLKPKIKIRYQVSHNSIINDTDIIDLPTNLLKALRLYVAFNYFSSLNGKEHSFKADKYSANYLKTINEDILDNNSLTSEIEFDRRFNDQGFV